MWISQVRAYVCVRWGNLGDCQEEVARALLAAGIAHSGRRRAFPVSIFDPVARGVCEAAAAPLSLSLLKIKIIKKTFSYSSQQNLSFDTHIMGGHIK